MGFAALDLPYSSYGHGNGLAGFFMAGKRSTMKSVYQTRGWDIRNIPIALGLLTCLLAMPARAADVPARADAAPARAAVEPFGQMFRLTLPLDDRGVSRLRRAVRQALDKARSQAARPVLIFEFEVPPDAAEGGRGSPFGSAFELAKFLSGDELNTATTVAYLPSSIQGHAVLVALACDQIIMAENATLGAAGVDEKVVDETLLSAYREIASRRRTMPIELAMGMLYPATDVILVHTEASTEYVTPAGLEELRKRHTIQSQEEPPLIRKGEPGQFSGAELRRLGFVKQLASHRLDVVRALGLPARVIEEDPSLGGPWRAVRVDLKGPINGEKVEQAVRLIKDEIRLHNVNFVCLWIDSPGGAPAESMRLAEFLVDEIDPATVRTVAYIPNEARADAALVAMACDQIVMHPQAVLGGPGAYQLSEGESKLAAQTMREKLAPRKLRAWSLWAAMIDPDVEVFRCTRLGDVEYFCEDELTAEQLKAGRAGKATPWQRGQRVTTPLSTFRVGGEQAVDYRLANHTVENLAQLKQLYDLEDDPTLVEPGWADLLIEMLRNPGVAAMLLILGGVALYLELHAPGIGIGGFIGTVCFILFFWSHYLGGTAGWLEIILFLTGIGCLLLEVFVLPGMGVFGLGGGALVLVSLVLASQTFVVPRNEYQFQQLQRSLLTIAGAAGGLILASLLLRRWLPRAPVFQHVMLEPPEGQEAQTISHREMLVHLADLTGVQGVTTTQLTPAGKARFGNTLIDVITSGECIARDTPVVVAEVHGNRVLVRAVDSG
jgi:membrane-bound ClpP family serine protease